MAIIKWDFGRNTKFSLMYLVIEKRPSIMTRVINNPELFPALADPLDSINTGRIKAELKVFDDADPLTEIVNPTFRQMMLAVNPRIVNQPKIKNGVEYIFAPFPMGPKRQVNGNRTMRQWSLLVEGLATLQTAGIPSWSGNIYNEIQWLDIFEKTVAEGGLDGTWDN